MLNTSGWSLEVEVEYLRNELRKAQEEIARLRGMMDDKAVVDEGDCVWVFGYGSLMWNPGVIPWVRRRACYIRGWKRRFWQRSTDHRGTMDAPGRVVTLVHTGNVDDDIVYGAAYAIPLKDAPSVEASLDHREKDAYVKHRQLELFDAHSGESFTRDALVYVGLKEAHLDNSEDHEHLARFIASRSGPSGTNSEYAIKLQNALTREGMHDPHVHGIVQWLYHI